MYIYESDAFTGRKSEAGIADCFLRDGEAQATLKTPVCEINVCPSIVDNSAIESSNEFPALEDALAELAYYREHGLVGPPGEAATITVGDVEASVPGSAPR